MESARDKLGAEITALLKSELGGSLREVRRYRPSASILAEEAAKAAPVASAEDALIEEERDED